MEQFTTVTGITVLAATVANIIVIVAGKKNEDITPQQKVAIGSLSALVVFFFGLVMFPQAYPDGPSQAMVVLTEAIIATLSAAGVPVYAEVGRKMRDERKAVDVSEPAKVETVEQTQDDLALAKSARTWGVWSR